MKNEGSLAIADRPLVSVIIPTYNSASTLELCLKSLKSQTYSNVETIIVDNYSVDDTVKIAKKYRSRIIQIKGLRSTARNYGAKWAKGDYLLFLDSDMELTSSVVEECAEKSRKSVDAVMIPEVRVGEGFWGKCREIERLTYIGDPLIESARFFRKEVFNEVRGYDEELEAGEDWDLHARVEDAGYRIRSIRAFMRHIEGYVSLEKIVKKRYYYGKTLMKYVRKHPNRAKIQFMPIRLNFVRNWKIVYKHFPHSFGMIFMKMVEYLVTMIALLFP